MTYRILLTVISSLFALIVSAQVTIGSDKEPVRAALLDLKTQLPGADYETSGEGGGGLVLPRVKLTNNTTLDPFIDSALDTEWNHSDNNVVTKLKRSHTGLMVYNLNDNPKASNENERFVIGIYVWDGAKWELTRGGGTAGTDQKFFYMPSINLELSDNPSTVIKCDLYTAYEKQFTGLTNASFISNNPTLAGVPLYTRSELDYVVTAYDGSVIRIISIEDTDPLTRGTLSYNALESSAPAGSFINIVFVIK